MKMRDEKRLIYGKTAYVQSNILPKTKIILHGQCPCVCDKFQVCPKTTSALHFLELLPKKNAKLEHKLTLQKKNIVWLVKNFTQDPEKVYKKIIIYFIPFFGKIYGTPTIKNPSSFFY